MIYYLLNINPPQNKVKETWHPEATINMYWKEITHSIQINIEETHEGKFPKRKT